MLHAGDVLLANRWQRGFPLAPRPFERVARQAPMTEDEVLAVFRRLRAGGVIDRIGPVFRPNSVGSSTLAAMAVPPGCLEAVASVVSAQRGVNHNYEREHRYNLWFVVTGASRAEVRSALAAIEQATGLPVLRLPLVEEYHIDLGFDLVTGKRGQDPFSVETKSSGKKGPDPFFEEKGPDPFFPKLVSATAPGLPLVPRPYEAVAQQLGVTEDEVLQGLEAMLSDGRIRRVGAVVRHRRLGYEANAMTVWDVPDAEVAAVGVRLAGEPAVTLCYRRARALPEWPYNLYCMVHGRERPLVEAEIRGIAARNGLDGYPHATLFSTRCFSQRAARYG